MKRHIATSVFIPKRKVDVQLYKKLIIEHGGKNNNESFKLVLIIIESLTSAK